MFTVVLTSIIYIFGSFSQSVTLIAIFTRTSWSQNSGLLLIISSLCCSELLNCLGCVVGCVESVAFLAKPNIDANFFLVNNVIGFFSCLGYNVMTWHLLAMAANRFTALLFPTYFGTAFSPRNTMAILAVSWIAGIAYGALKYVFCCPLVWVVEFVASASPYDPASNKTYALVVPDSMLSAVGSIIPSVLYICVAARLVQLSRSASNSGVSSYDPKLCLQFVIILVIYMINSVSWIVSPVLPFLDYVQSILNALNFSTNPLIYWLFNETIREAVTDLLHFSSGSTPVHSWTNSRK